MKLKKTILAAVLLAAVSASAIIPLTACGGGDTTPDTVLEETADDTEQNRQAEIPQDMKSETAELSEGTYITTPATKDLSVAEDGYSIFVNNVLFVYAERNTPEKDVEALAKKYEAKIVGANSSLDIYQLQFEKAMTMDELTDLAAELENEDCVELAETDSLLEINESYMPSDKWYDNDKEDDEADDNASRNQWGLNAIHAQKAWDYLDYMQNVNVAVVEGDVDEDHEDLNIRKEINPSFGSAVVSAVTDGEHGAHVAGILAATPDNGKGIAGICAVPGTEIYVCHNWSKITVKHATFGLAELVTKYGVKVINISQYSNAEAAIISASHGNKKAQEAIEDQASRAVKPLKRLLEDGYEFVIVVAAGNQNEKVCWKDITDTAGYGYTIEKSSPFRGDTEYIGADAKYSYYLNAIEDRELKDRIIVVGAAAMVNEETSCGFSNTGDRVDIMAPGENIFSCKEDNTYGLISGTSQAAPHVAGVAAMIFGCNPDLTGAEVKEILTITADYDCSFDKVNAGLLQADKAVEFVLNTGAYSGEKQNGLISFMNMTYEEMMPNVDELYFTETIDEPGVWYATGDYGGDASLSFKLSGYQDVGGCKPVSMTVSALNEEKVCITEDITLNMEYHHAEMLDNVTEGPRDAENNFCLIQRKDGYEITMRFHAYSNMDSVLKTVTITKTE